MPATLRSNGGESELTIELGEPAEYAHDDGFESSIHIKGRHWDGDHEHPFHTTAEGLWLRSADLVALRNHIVNWTKRPLDRLFIEDLAGDFELACLPEQSLHIHFGPRPDTTPDQNPVVSITLSAGAQRSEFYFMTDQSCLRIFAQELSI